MGLGRRASDQDDSGRLTLEDVFQLEFTSNPEISPDGSKIVFVRNFMDIMKDRQRSNLWIVNYDGSDLRPITTGNHNYNSPRWSPDGMRLLYASNEEGSTQLYVRWMETGQVAKLTQLTNSPGGLTWSPDGNSIAFSMFVPSEMRPLVTLPQNHYMARSPLSLVGNVTTPTMLLTGEEDYRTPMSESEQFYQALKLQGKEASLVRIPGASHGITARPSNLMAKVAYVLAWFERYRRPTT